MDRDATRAAGNVTAKISFDDIYNLPDPREYYVRLGAYDYQTPQNGVPLFAAVIDALRARRGLTKVRILDLCCGYGVNAALLKHGLGFAALRARYAEMAALSPEAVIARDREMIAARPGRPDLWIAGLDIAPNAIRYGVETGLLDAGVVANLERGPPDAALDEIMAATDLVMVTGAMAYLTRATFTACLAHGRATPRPWVGVVCHRVVDFSPIAEALSAFGMVTEQPLDWTFPHRRFAGAEEQEGALAALSRLGRSPHGREAAGYFHSDFFLVRPVEDVSTRTGAVILSGVNPAEINGVKDGDG